LSLSFFDRATSKKWPATDLYADPPLHGIEAWFAKTVSDLCGEYLAKAEAGLIIGRKGLPKKASTLEIDRGRIARHIVPLLGKKTLKDLTSADIKRFLKAVSIGKTAAAVDPRPHASQGTEIPKLGGAVFSRASSKERSGSLLVSAPSDTTPP
jgi:hypothetical protein